MGAFVVIIALLVIIAVTYGSLRFLDIIAALIVTPLVIILVGTIAGMFLEKPVFTTLASSIILAVFGIIIFFSTKSFYKEREERNIEGHAIWLKHEAERQRKRESVTSD